MDTHPRNSIFVDQHPRNSIFVDAHPRNLVFMDTHPRNSVFMEQQLLLPQDMAHPIQEIPGQIRSFSHPYPQAEGFGLIGSLFPINPGIKTGIGI